MSISTESFSTWEKFPNKRIPKKDAVKEHSEKMLNLETRDISWRINARKWYGLFFCILLVLQNTFIFWLVSKAFHYDQLKDANATISIIITGTLVETAFIIRIMVQWLFSDINYQSKKA